MWNGLEQETLRKGGHGVVATRDTEEGFQDEAIRRQGRGGGGSSRNNNNNNNNHNGAGGGGRSQESRSSSNRRPPQHKKPQQSSHPQQISTTTFVKTTKRRGKRTRAGNSSSTNTSGTTSNSRSSSHPTVVTTVLQNSSPFTDIQKQHNAMAEKHGLLKGKRRYATTDHFSSSTTEIHSSTPATSTSTYVSDMEDTPPHSIPNNTTNNNNVPQRKLYQKGAAKSLPMDAIKSMPLPPDSPKTMRRNRHPQSIKESFAQARQDSYKRRPPSPLVHQPNNSRPKQPITNVIITKSLENTVPEPPPLAPIDGGGGRIDDSARNLMQKTNSNHSLSLHSSSSHNNNNNNNNNDITTEDRRISWQQQTGALRKAASSSSSRELDNSKGSQQSASHRSFLGNLIGRSNRHVMTKEEREKAHNPFYRPKMIPKHSSTHMVMRTNSSGDQSGHHSGHGSGSDHQRRTDDTENGHHHHHHHHHGGNGGNSNNGGGNMELSERSANSNVHVKTLQEKYCPLPKPLQKVHDFCGVIVTNQAFQIFMVILIMMNALVLGIATYDFDNDKISDVLDIVDKAFLVVFTIELALQFAYCGYTLFLDGWLVFDTLTVVTSWWLEGVQVFRSFRIFRSFRLIVRLPLLKNLVLTVFHVMPRVNSILCLLILILYIYGVMVTVLFKDMFAAGELDQNYFGRLDYSLFTLFQMVTLEGWGDVVRQVADKHKIYASLIFSSFIIITGFIMYNLIVAVMCDSMLVVEQQGREEKRQQKEAKERAAKLEEQAEEERWRQEHKDDPVSIDKHDGIPEPPSYYPHTCQHCGETSDIPKYPKALRRRHHKRDVLAEENQIRIRALGEKVNALGQVQQKVMVVLEQLMSEIGGGPIMPPEDARGRRTNQS